MVSILQRGRELCNRVIWQSANHRRNKLNEDPLLLELYDHWMLPQYRQFFMSRPGVNQSTRSVDIRHWR
ncbi:hypothetical protein Nepgr_021503 [Nepenthes gracilis]|uniref:Uncharacterized protein n=1 Tax=Nepenthes gracilis TaxID=150966 RepID=A0AAD3XVZ9_NEPGR|nr:hypothetical protein Nepgr_021503 [Nepenthes gracilis]